MTKIANVSNEEILEELRGLVGEELKVHRQLLPIFITSTHCSRILANSDPYAFARTGYLDSRLLTRSAFPTNGLPGDTLLERIVPSRFCSTLLICTERKCSPPICLLVGPMRGQSMSFSWLMERMFR